MQELPEALAGLADYRQFMTYRLEQRGARLEKIPQNLQGQTADSQDPNNWTDFATASAAAQAVGGGVAFVFTERDPFFFLDVDNCVTDAGEWTPIALELFRRFAGAGVELSSSGRGVHIFGRGSVDRESRKVKSRHGFDLFTEQRFVALTGNHTSGDVNTEHTEALGQLVVDYLQKDPAQLSTEWSSEPVPEWKGHVDDAKLLQAMLGSVSASAAFGTKATPQQLFAADEDALAIAYPDTQGAHAFDRSAADAALCAHLAFWTGKDCERIDRLFRLSALVRDKWLEREDYRRLTILNACAGCESVHGDKQAMIAQAEPVHRPQLAEIERFEAVARDGLQFMTIPEQITHFADCVYVVADHKVLMPNGQKLKPEQFKVVKGGYRFALDYNGDKETKNAWEAFSESQGAHFPIADETCFRPELPFGSIIHEESRLKVNNYYPIEIDAVEGDVEPFLRHLELLLPVQGDRDILLAYMAACVQYKGTKFQWAPLLQGAEGNGKTLIIKVLCRAIGRRYTHTPNPSDLGNKFNAWIMEKLFIGVEELHVADRQDLIDALKPMITNELIEGQGKGADQVMIDNRANFVLLSNHKDAIRKTRDDRRYCVFYTQQQSAEDLAACGMNDSYFNILYGWLKSGGYGAVTHYLSHYEIPEQLNPATTCQRAPITSSTAAAIAASRGSVEQELLEAIDEGRTGLAGGWISSIALSKFLDSIRAGRKVPPAKRGEMLRELGYIPHPVLTGGRVTGSSPIDDGKKPRLYIKDGHLHAFNLKNSAEVLGAYLKAQGCDLDLTAQFATQEAKR